MNNLTSQLLFLESHIMRKQKHIANILSQRELTIVRQQKLIDALSSRLVDHGLDTGDPGGFNDFDSLNDSDSAVVLEDVDSDCNTSFIGRRKSGPNDITIIRSISDAIETNVNKYPNTRRSNCFLRRPDILETVYSVEEDSESVTTGTDLSEKRDKFKHRTEKVIMDCSEETPQSHELWPITVQSVDRNNKQTQVTNYNRVMSNHRSVTKPKDVKYKRINKAKSKSLEELRGRLKHWVDKGSSNGYT